MPNAKGYTVTFDGVASTTFPSLICEKVTRRLVGKDRSVTREVSGMEGAWRFPDKRGLRTIILDMAVVSDGFPTPRRDDLREIADWVDKQGFLKLAISDEPGVYNLAFLANEPDIDEWRELGTFSLEFSAMPYTYSDTISTDLLTLTPSGANIWASAESIPVYPVIELTPVGGVLTGFTLQVGEFSLSYQDLIADGDTITISSLNFTVSLGANTDTDLAGTFVFGDLNMVNVSGTFPVFILGNNDVLLTESGGSTAITVDLDIYWRSRYR